jgi:hypothetical protein
MQRLAALPLILAVSACGQVHRFEIRSDEAMKSAVVELRNKSTLLKIRDEHFASGELAIGGDADGRLIIVQASGRTTVCPVGYVTDGEDEPHRFAVGRGKCTWQSSG